jgi:hypothetical protein
MGKWLQHIFQVFCSRGIPASFSSLSLTKWALSHIEIHEEYPPWWNAETDTSLWEPHNLMHTNTFWVLPWRHQARFYCCHHGLDVPPPWNSSHLFLVPRIQQRSFGRINKHVELIGQFKEIPWGSTHSPLVPFVAFSKS